MQRLSLTGEWQYRRADGGDWATGVVPGDVYSDLLRDGEIPDPFVGRNELDVRWVGESDWEYRRTVEVDASFLAHDRLLLSFEGLDTVADVFVNDVRVGSAENMHRAQEFDVEDALRPGENELQVRFRSPVEVGRERANAHPHDVWTNRYEHDQPARNFVRKAQCHYGWDWGPCLPTVGIWRDVSLVGYSAPRVTYTTTRQTHDDESEAVRLDVRIGVDAPEAGTYELTASVAGVTERTTRSLPAGATDQALSLTVDAPDLWWPTGYGDQPLYDLTVSVGPADASNVYSTRLGFRDLEVVREPDRSGAGESFFVRVNGEPIFAKGANWIPVDALPGRYTDERYDDLLESALAANMNMLRVWGGGVYEKDLFYERCDELGILVWQDFMFACSLYPADEAFLDGVDAEVRAQVRRLADHPSIALWCGNNENEWGIEEWFDVDDVERARDEYERLYEGTIGRAVREEDLSRTYWPSSPSSGGERDAGDEAFGDVHYWDVWHGGEPFERYRDVEPRFASEFGFQSFPSRRTLATTLDETEHNPTAPGMEHHQRHPDGNSLIVQHLTDRFRFPFDFDDFVYLSQVQQALAMKTAIEHWRRLKPYCMGTLYWQLNDVWPCASWSSIEYGGQWKALHHFARRFYAPVLPSLTVADDAVTAHVTSDLTEPVVATVTLEAYRLVGDRLDSRSVTVELPAHASEAVGHWRVDDLVGETPRENVAFRLRYDGPGAAYDNVAFLEPYKRLALPDPDLTVAVTGDEVTLGSEAAALFVRLDAGDRTGRFADNYVHLFPGEARTIAFEPDEDDDGALADELAVTHLRETY